jgi:hypothetical protein
MKLKFFNTAIVIHLQNVGSGASYFEVFIIWQV